MMSDLEGLDKTEHLLQIIEIYGDVVKAIL